MRDVFGNPTKLISEVLTGLGLGERAAVLQEVRELPGRGGGQQPAVPWPGRSHGR
jgi:hypothetical protein